MKIDKNVNDYLTTAIEELKQKTNTFNKKKQKLDNLNIEEIESMTYI